jgi:hypothetical protein
MIILILKLWAKLTLYKAMHQSLHPQAVKKNHNNAGGLWIGFVWPPTQGDLSKGPQQGSREDGMIPSSR